MRYQIRSLARPTDSLKSRVKVDAGEHQCLGPGAEEVAANAGGKIARRGSGFSLRGSKMRTCCTQLHPWKRIYCRLPGSLTFKCHVTGGHERGGGGARSGLWGQRVGLDFQGKCGFFYPCTSPSRSRLSFGSEASPFRSQRHPPGAARAGQPGPLQGSQ